MNGEPQPAMGEPNLLHSIWSHKLLVFASIGVFALLGLVVTTARPTRYVGEAGVVLQDPLSSSLSANRNSSDEVRYVADQVEVLKSAAVAQRASAVAAAAPDHLTIDSQDVQRDLSVISSSNSNFVLVRYEASHPTIATVGANAVVKAYRDLIKADLQAQATQKVRQLDAAIAAAKARAARDPSGAAVLLNVLRGRRSQVQVDYELAGDGVSLASLATKGKAQGFSTFVALVIGVVLGGLIGSGIAYWLDARKKAFSGVFQPQALMGVAALAEVPDFPSAGVGSKLPVLNAPGTEAAEAFRFLASSIGLPREIRGAEGGPEMAASKSRVVAFVASSFGAGTTTLTANAAIAAAQEGLRVLVIDADVGMRDLSRLLVGDNEETVDGASVKMVDLSEMLRIGPTAESIRRVTKTSAGGSLTLLGPGIAPRRRSDVFRAEQMLPTPDLIGDRFDLVLVDVPAVLQVAYADALLRFAESVVLVVPHRSDSALLKRALDRLDLLAVRPMGYVYNLAPSRQRGRREVFGRAERLVVELGGRARKAAAR